MLDHTTTSLLLYFTYIALIISGIVLIKLKKNHPGHILLAMAATAIVTENLVLNGLIWSQALSLAAFVAVILFARYVVEVRPKKKQEKSK